MNTSSLMMPSTPKRRGSSFATPPSSTSKAQLRSKFTVSYESLLAGEQPWLYTSGTITPSLNGTPMSPSASSSSGSYFSPSGKKPSAPRARFFADLLCLKVETDTIAKLMQSISARQLTNDDEGSKGARIRENIGSLWRECLRVWKDVTDGRQDIVTQNITTDEVRRMNAADTLIALSHNILAKKFAHSSSSLDLIWIFAGGIDEADDIFEDLVDAIDQGLQGDLENPAFLLRRSARTPSSEDVLPAKPRPQARYLPTLQELFFHRRRAVHLAITWISRASTTNLSAYFVRRDLFIGASNLLGAVQAIHRSVNASPNKQGLSEADTAFLAGIVRDTSLLIALLAAVGQTGGSAMTGINARLHSVDASTSPYFRRMCDWVDSGSMHLLRDVLRTELQQASQAYNKENATANGYDAGLAVNAVTKGIKMMTTFANEGVAVDAALPNPGVSCLLVVYLLCRANALFVEVATDPNPPDRRTAEEGNAQPKSSSFTAALISLSSFLATHGSISDRARSYSRLALLTQLGVLQSPKGFAALSASDRAEDVTQITLCTHRAGPLSAGAVPGTAETASTGFKSIFSQLSFSASSESSRKQRNSLLPSVLDVCTQYLRHNLRKSLDTYGYLLCLQVILISIQGCAERRLQLSYSEWPDVWSALISSAIFLVGRHTELRGVEIGKLGQALLSILSLALLESDRFLASRHDVDILAYDIIRNVDPLKRLAAIVATGKDSKAPDGVDVEVPARTINAALPMWRLIDLLLLTFDHNLREWGEKKGRGRLFGGGGGGMTSLVSSLTGGYLGGSVSTTTTTATTTTTTKISGTPNGSTPTSSSGGRTTSAQRLPDVQTVMSLINAIDMEQLIHTFHAENEGGGGGGGGASNSGMRNGLSSPAVKCVFIDAEWLERAESQCLTEVFRYASEDVRQLISAAGVATQ